LLSSSGQKAAQMCGWLGIGGSVCIMSMSALILYLWPEELIGLFTKDVAVLQAGASIIFLCVCFQIFDGIQVVAAGALRGLGNTKLALLSNLVSHWAIGLPVGIYVCFFLKQGIWGLWLGLALGLCATACCNCLAWKVASRTRISSKA
jgi:MATE family multidrug resistance protein